MLFDSSDDDLPDIPMVPAARPAAGRGGHSAVAAVSATSLRDDQMQRLQNLEEQFRLLREEMSSLEPPPSVTGEGIGAQEHGAPAPSRGALVSRRRSLRQQSGSADRIEQTEPNPTSEAGIESLVPAVPPAPQASLPLDKCVDPALETTNEAHEDVMEEGRSDALRDQEIHYELRRLVPHLSPAFACSYRDAVLLIGAIRNGGSGAVRGHESLMDRITAAEAERRALDSRLAKKTEDCEALRQEVEHARQKVRAVQQQAQQSITVLSQKREEMRKQLLIEESRTEKIQVKNKKLERENEELKARLRNQLR